MPNTRLAIYTTRSLLHVGTGQALGDIDRPVSRQITTQLPDLPGPPQKRALKDALSVDRLAADGSSVAVPALSPMALRALFGADAVVVPEGSEANGASPGATGQLTPQAGELLLLPVACGAGGCAWVTSPSIWARFRRAARRAGVAVPPLPDKPRANAALCAAESPLVTRIGGQGAWVVLGPAVLGHQPPAAMPALGQPANESAALGAKAWADWAKWVANCAFGADDMAWQDLVAERLAVLPDAVFDPLVPLALATRARNRIDETTGIVSTLWREEAVPEDTVFQALLGAQRLDSPDCRYDLPEKVLDTLSQHIGTGGLPLQLGGLGSVGHGHLWLRLIAPDAPPATPANPAVEPGHAG